MRAIMGPVLVWCGLISPAYGDELEIAVGTNDLDPITYEGRTLYGFEVVLEDSVLSRALVSADLEMKYGPQEGAEAARTEVQIAAWSDSGPIVPEGKFRPISLSICSDETEYVHVDITDILGPAFLRGQEGPIKLVIGRVLDWDADQNAPLIGAVDPESGVWGILHLALE